MSSQPNIKIASRTSALAMWQTEAVKTQLEKLGLKAEILPVESTGDMQLTQPIYALGVTGVFTKQLDLALLNKEADVAVHSLKDVPTQLAKGLVLAATLPRGPYEDVVIVKYPELLEDKNIEAVVATSSLRRTAQWLAKYPNHRIVPIRGNVQTRLSKFEESAEMEAVIFAKAGLERLDLLSADAVVLDWMLPAPAQGIIGIVCREDDTATFEACQKFNHQPTFIEGSVERQFMNAMMGGCSVPISGLAQLRDNELEFYGAMHSFDGRRSFKVHHVVPAGQWKNAGADAAQKLLRQLGATHLLDEIRGKKWNDETALN